MRILPWFSNLLNLLEEGSVKSPILEDLARPERMIQMSQEICLRTWPLITAIPENVAKVRKLLPAEMIYAGKFFDQVADKDEHFQRLYFDQCRFFHLNPDQLKSAPQGEETTNMRALFEAQCSSDNLQEGVLAILTVELAATFFGRRSYRIAEDYFKDPGHNSINGRKFSEQELVQGLAWARYHAKPNARQALWIKGMSEEINLEPPNKLPQSVILLVDAIYKWWWAPVSQLMQRELIKK